MHVRTDLRVGVTEECEVEVWASAGKEAVDNGSYGHSQPAETGP